MVCAPCEGAVGSDDRRPGKQQSLSYEKGKTFSPAGFSAGLLCCLSLPPQIHVKDDDPFSLTRGGGLEDVSLVQKYRMSEEDYDKRKGTLR